MGKHFSNQESGQEAAGKKPRSVARVISTVLITLGVVLLLVAGGMYGLARYRYWKQDQINQQLAQHVVINTPVVKDEPQEEEVKKCPVEVDWASLKAINKDVIGWIYVPDTVINYPVYQGVDNDQYLRTDAQGNYSVGGQIFLDSENTKPGMVDQQSILFGHHLWDGTMFQPLSLLDDQEVFDKTTSIWYVTEEQAFETEPLFMYYVDPEDESVRQFNFDTEAEFHNYLKKQLERAVTRRQDAEQLIDKAKRVLTMSTCNYYDGYGRSILVTIEKE